MPSAELKMSATDISRIKKFLNASPAAVNLAMRKAFSAEARLIMKESQKLVPVITGLLKSSKFIGRSKTNGTVTKINVGYQVTKAGKSNPTGYDYAPVVEHGRKETNPFPGRFYMRKAVRSTKSGRDKRIAKFVRAELKRLGF